MAPVARPMYSLTVLVLVKSTRSFRRRVRIAIRDDLLHPLLGAYARP